MIKFTGLYQTDWTGFEFTWKGGYSPLMFEKWRVMPAEFKADSEWAIAPIDTEDDWVNDEWHRQWHWFGEEELMQLLIYQLQERLQHLGDDRT